MGESLINESILATIPIGKQEYVIDVADYNLIFDEDIFLGIEIIIQSNNENIIDGIWFRCGTLNGPTLIRESAHSAWRPIEDSFLNAGAGFGLTVRQ